MNYYILYIYTIEIRIHFVEKVYLQLQLLLFFKNIRKNNRNWILPGHWLKVIVIGSCNIYLEKWPSSELSRAAVSWPQIKSMVDGWIDLRVIDTIRNNNSCSAFFPPLFLFLLFFIFPVYLYISIHNVVKIYSRFIIQIIISNKIRAWLQFRRLIY